MRSLTKNKKGGAFALVLIIILIVVAVLIIPQIVSGEGFSFDDIINSIQNFINGLTGGGDTDGYVGVGFTIHYSDGTTEDFGASPTFQISPLSIKVVGKPVDSIDVIVRAKFITSNITSWSSEVTQQIEVYKEPTTSSSEPYFSSTGYFNDNGDSWDSGTVKNLAVTTFEASVLDDLVDSYGAGSWAMQVNVSVDLEAVINGVNEVFDGLAPSGGIGFTYSTDGDTPSLSVSTGTTPIS